MPRPDARPQLLDAAERLFAEQGISSVSDRQVAEAAGNSNHSAVRYYFGGRAGLLAALLARHEVAVEPERRRRLEASVSLLGDIRALVIPLTEVLAALPVPSWRARFLGHAISDPATMDDMRGVGGRFPATIDIARSATDRLAHLDRPTVEARARLAAHIVRTACAEVEQDAASTGKPADWAAVGVFLCDALAGMLQAPITAQVSDSSS